MLIDKLAQASQAGVEVVMNVRGICCLLPGIPGLTDRVTVFSIVGRYLEHTRIYRFGCGEDADLFLSSADFMTRNTERRVEVACPILDPELRRRVFHITDVLISDNVKARQLGPDGCGSPRENGLRPAPARRCSSGKRRRRPNSSSNTPRAPPGRKAPGVACWSGWAAPDNRSALTAGRPRRIF